MNNEIQEQVNNLSMMEQNMQHLSAQRQSFQTQLLEVESALEEIGTAKETYKIIGTIMVKTEPSKLKEELESKKQLLEIRVKSIEKQEDAAKEKAKMLQNEIMSKIDGQKPESEKKNNKEKKQKKEEE
ncbi:MAG: prefoldin subunit beta [Candidatus Nanoarchaeia archaeon]